VWTRAALLSLSCLLLACPPAIDDDDVDIPSLDDDDQVDDDDDLEPDDDDAADDDDQADDDDATPPPCAAYEGTDQEYAPMLSQRPVPSCQAGSTPSPVRLPTSAIGTFTPSRVTRRPPNDRTADAQPLSGGSVGLAGLNRLAAAGAGPARRREPWDLRGDQSPGPPGKT